jgi:hypothetical protein
VKLQKKAFFVLCSPIIFLCSCATVGHDIHPKLETFKLGQFTRSDCKKLFGTPNNETDKTTSAGEFDTLNYSYIQNVIGSVSVRDLIFEFKNGVLNGYEYISSFDKDKTTVDLSKVNQIKAGIGRLTREDVSAALGQPYGKALCPSTLGDYKEQSKEGAEIWSWFISEKLHFGFFWPHGFQNHLRLCHLRWSG